MLLYFFVIIIFVSFFQTCKSNPDAKRLYDDLISKSNKLVRPVLNETDPLTVHIKLKLSQLIEVNLKNQIMTTNLWVEQYWQDYKLTWDPNEYGGVETLQVPSDHIWRPDIVLYNNADGNFEVTLATKAQVSSNGKIQWKPPAIYKSSCQIDVEYFPFDEQTCVMKFGSWTYDGFKVDLRHKDEVDGSSLVKFGIDLSEFYLSVEWDLLDVPAKRNEKYYTCCEEPYIDITFNVSMRRKTLFYTVNLIIPCIGISFLTILVFYLPSDSGEKVALSTSILLSLTVFFLLLAEIIPPTSLVVPLLGKYLLFTMILVTFSICVTVMVLNFHFRSSSTHKMAPWVKSVFMEFLPKVLNMKRPSDNKEDSSSGQKKILDKLNIPLEMFEEINLMELQSPTTINYDPTLPIPRQRRNSNESSEIDQDKDGTFTNFCMVPGHQNANVCQSIYNSTSKRRIHFCPEFIRAVENVHYIVESIRNTSGEQEIKEDWKFVAMVLDRVFLWFFATAVLVGSCGIILSAPTLYDKREPIDIKLSEVALAVLSKRN